MFLEFDCGGGYSRQGDVGYGCYVGDAFVVEEQRCFDADSLESGEVLFYYLPFGV